MTPSDPLDSLRETVFAHREELCAVARREGLRAEDAVDAVSEGFAVFLSAALRGAAPEAPEQVRRYLIGIVRNRARNERRRAHRRLSHQPLDEEAAAGGRASDELLREAEEHVRLRACVAKLCDTQRAVVTLRVLEERPGEDVAAQLGLARGHVDVLLHRAKGSLRACMLEETDAA